MNSINKAMVELETTSDINQARAICNVLEKLSYVGRLLVQAKQARLEGFVDEAMRMEEKAGGTIKLLPDWADW